LLLSCILSAQETDLDFQNMDLNKSLLEFENIEDYSIENHFKKYNSSQFGSKVLSNTTSDFRQIQGNINLRYSYGLNTVFTDTSRGIASIIGSTGEFKTDVLGLPVMIGYNYSTMKMPLGANNYFRISFDKQKYLDEQTGKLDEEFNKVLNAEDKLKAKKAKLSNLQGQTEVYLDMLKRLMERKLRMLALQKREDFNDSISEKNISTSSSYPKDSIVQKSEETEEVTSEYKNQYNSILDGYQKILLIQKSYDSLIEKYDAYKENISIDRRKIENSEFDIDKKNSYNKIGFVKSIQKVEIGLTYPRTTALSNQSTAIKGVGTEFQYQNYYLAFSSGLTINNTMMSTNEITNQLENNQNVFNQFDFQQVKDNGLLTTIKTGWGTPDNNHAFVGFNYLTNTRFFNSKNNSESIYDPAASVELDLRYIPTLYNGGTLDLVYGKTSSNKKIDSTEREVFGTLFSNYHSNVLMLKYSQIVTKIKSDFSIQYRLIDPNANTSVYGMLQPGNKRIAFTTRHRISPFLNIGTNHKLDESYGTKNKISLKTTGANVSGNITDYLFYSTMFNYVEFATNSEEGNRTNGASYLAGVNLQSLYKIKYLKGGLAVNYNDYLFSDTSSTVKYTQIGLNKMLGNKKWSVSLNYDYFFQNSGGLEKGSNVYGINGKYNLKRIQFNSGLNLLVDNELKKSLGGHIEVKFSITQKIDLNMRAERFVLGNFYTNYYRKLYEQLPYLFSFNMNFKL